MSFFIETLRTTLLADARATVAPLVNQLRGASCVLPVLVGAEHKRLNAIRGRLAEIECETEETLSRRDANARRLDALGNSAATPKPPESVQSSVAFPFVGKWARP